MNCHGNNIQNNSAEKGRNLKSHFPHMLMMVLCCGAPIIILLILPVVAKGGGAIGTATFLAAVAPFICPLMMVLMLPMMLIGKKNKSNKNGYHQNSNIQLEDSAQKHQ